MDERVKQELSLLRRYYPDLGYQSDGRWVHVPSYRLPPNWNRRVTDVVFQIPVGYPGTQPYGIYVPLGIRYNDIQPQSYKEPSETQPPFPGPWGFFSWQPLDGQWCPSADLVSGSNLLNWARGFVDRFREGV